MGDTGEAVASNPTLAEYVTKFIALGKDAYIKNGKLFINYPNGAKQINNPASYIKTINISAPGKKPSEAGQSELEKNRAQLKDFLKDFE